MLKFVNKIIKLTTFQITNRLLLLKASRPAFVFANQFKMAGVSSKMKSDLNLDENPTKKIKLTLNDVATRTVATMCGAWRPEEEDGGMILVFQTRKPCLSPDPEKESDFPENAEDFWDAALHCSGDEQGPKDEFAVVDLPFSGFEAYYRGQLVGNETLDISQITSIGIQMYGGVYLPVKQYGPATLEIDWIKAA